MIKVVSFSEISAFGLSCEIEDFVRAFNIGASDIVSLNIDYDTTLREHCAILMYKS